VLICDEARCCLSNVICEYLDGMHPDTQSSFLSSPALVFVPSGAALAQALRTRGIAAPLGRVDGRLSSLADDARRTVEKIAQACDFLSGDRPGDEADTGPAGKCRAQGPAQC